MTYAIDPTQPLPKRWNDKKGPIRLLMATPVEGYVMARRPGAAPFVLSVVDLLSGHWTPILPKPRIDVRKKVSEIKAAQDRNLKEIAHEVQA